MVNKATTSQRSHAMSIEANTTMKMSGARAAKLRTEMIDILQQWQSDKPAIQSTDIFFPMTHIRALALDRTLAIGMHGVGKSFLVDLLTNEHLRAQATQFINGYDKVIHVRAIYGHKNILGTNYPSRELLLENLKNKMDTILLWSTLVLNELRGICAQCGVVIQLPKADQGWDNILTWARQNKDKVQQTIMQLNESLSGEGKIVLVVMDEPEQIASQISPNADYLRGLFHFLSDTRQFKGLRFKAFLREDAIHVPGVMSFPGAPKLMNEAIHLQ